MFMKDFSATLLIPTRIHAVHRDAERRAMTRFDEGDRGAASGRVVEAIVANILRPRLG